MEGVRQIINLGRPRSPSLGRSPRANPAAWKKFATAMAGECGRSTDFPCVIPFYVASKYFPNQFLICFGLDFSLKFERIARRRFFLFGELHRHDCAGYFAAGEIFKEKTPYILFLEQAA